MLKRKEIEGYQYFRLDNGIKLIHRQNNAPVSHLALMVNTGSRDEDLSENGVAHLIEHMIFKGTNKRKAFHVISFLENVGCDLNAYTTKEETCIHGTFLKAYYDRALELFADIAFNSVFPAKELEKEKEVILDEINSYKDSPSEEIFDEYENLLFSGHPIGRNILGTTETVKSFTRNHILRFIKKNYKTSEIVIASVGNIDFEKLKKHVSRHFGVIPATDNPNRRQPFESYSPRTQKEERDNYLSHCLIGNIAYQYDHPKKHSLVLLNNVLGGPGLNSRLNLNIREKYGFAYNIDSQYTSYTDTGWFGVYLGTDPESVTKAESLVKKELKKLCNERLGTLQLARAKQQLIVQLAISIESGLTETLSIARAHLQKDNVDSMEDIIRSIRNLDSSDLLEVANEVFEPSQLSTLIFAGNKS
ncbi:MAG: pitrilysin family protein [Bacteroidales bacterium]|nr:pitrilysin family protein [Bacteroidales bacterium]